MLNYFSKLLILSLPKILQAVEKMFASFSKLKLLLNMWQDQITKYGQPTEKLKMHHVLLNVFWAGMARLPQ